MLIHYLRPVRQILALPSVALGRILRILPPSGTKITRQEKGHRPSHRYLTSNAYGKCVQEKSYFVRFFLHTLSFIRLIGYPLATHRHLTSNARYSRSLRSRSWPSPVPSPSNVQRLRKVCVRKIVLRPLFLTHTFLYSTHRLPSGNPSPSNVQRQILALPSVALVAIARPIAI